jgi:DNA-binding response OmpR family regulator
VTVDTARLVVVVDDDEQLLELAVRALKRANVEVRGAKDFPALMELLEEVSPAVILMDVNMPELFGDEVAGILKGGQATSAKILLHSSLDEEELRKLASDAGIDGYIGKSQGTAHMVARVKELLEG